MASFRSRLFVFMLKHRNLLQFGKKSTIEIDWDTSIPDLRKEIEASLGNLGPMPAGIEVSDVSADGFSGHWVTPAQAKKDRVILYFHGGGYVVGSSRSHCPIVAKFVKGSGVGALVVDYHLAPEHPFPSALDDCVAAYRWLLDEGVSPSNIAFIGDSAGGGLSLATLVSLKDKGLPLPAASVTLSPWTDLTNSGASVETNAKIDKLTWPGSLMVFSKYYAGDCDPVRPDISPLFGNLEGFPPMLMYVGGDEALLDDSTRFAKKAADSGVDVKLTVEKGMFHCYPACSPLFPEAKRAMDEICEFIKKHIGKDVTNV